MEYNIKNALEVAMKYWSKSSLSIYRYLEKMTNTLDKLILDLSKHSNNVSMIKNQTTYNQARKLIELLDRKRKMINLKVAVEDSLAGLNKIDRRILTLVFIDGAKSEMIAQILGVSLRTFFRKKVIALNKFNSQMIAKGFDLDFFIREYSKEQWILSVYDECVNKYNKEDETMDVCIVKRVLNEISKVTLGNSIYVC